MPHMRENEPSNSCAAFIHNYLSKHHETELSEDGVKEQVWYNPIKNQPWKLILLDYKTFLLWSGFKGHMPLLYLSCYQYFFKQRRPQITIFKGLHTTWATDDSDVLVFCRFKWWKFKLASNYKYGNWILYYASVIMCFLWWYW